MAACSNGIAFTLREPALELVLQILAVELLFVSLSSAPLGILRAELRFGVIAVTSAGVSVLQTISAVLLAYYGFGVLILCPSSSVHSVLPGYYLLDLRNTVSSIPTTNWAMALSNQRLHGTCHCRTSVRCSGAWRLHNSRFIKAKPTKLVFTLLPLCFRYSFVVLWLENFNQRLCQPLVT